MTHLHQLTEMAAELDAARAHIANLETRLNAYAASHVRSLDHYQHIVENSHDLICLYSTDFKITYANRAYCNYAGMNSDEIIGTESLQRFPFEDHVSFLTKIKSLSIQNAIAAYECQSLAPDGTPCWVEWTDQALFDAHGQVVEYQATGRDITAQKQLQKHSEDATNRYQLLCTAMTGALFILHVPFDDSAGRFIDVNDNACELLGYPREALLQMTLSDVDVHLPEDNAASLVERIKDAEIFAIDQLYLTKGGRIIPIELHARYAMLQDTPVIIAIAQDITARKAAEKERLLFEAGIRQTQDAVIVTDAPDKGSSHVVFANEAISRITGLGLDDILGKSVDELQVPGTYWLETQDIRLPLEVLMETGTFSGTMFSYHQNGADLFLQFTISPIKDVTGKVTNYISVIRDITRQEQQKRVLEELTREIQANHDQITSILDSVDDVIWSSTLPGNQIIHLSKSFEKVYGYPAYKFTSDPDFYRKVIYPQDLPQVEHVLQMALQTGFAELEHRIVWPDGSVRWIHRSTWIRFDEQKNPIRVDGVSRDITLRKRSEQSIHLQNAILQQSNELIGISDTTGTIVYLNDSGAVLLGYDHPHTLIGMNIRAFYTPETSGYIFTVAMPTALETTFWRGEMQIKTRSGRLIDVDQSIFPIWDDFSQTQYYATIVVEITEKKSALRSLQASEIRYRQMFEMHRLPKLIIDPDTGIIVDANPASEAFYGYTTEALKQLSMLDITQAPADEIIETLQQAKCGEVKSFIFKQRLASGDIRDIEIFTGQIDDDGKILLYSIHTDITARRQAEDALQQAYVALEQRVQERTAELAGVKNRLEAIFNNSGDGIVLIDTDRRIQQGNFTFGEMFGLGQDSYMGLSLTDLVQHSDIGLIQTSIQQVLYTHAKQHLETIAHRQDGTLFAVEISLAPVNRSDQLGATLVCIIRDVTERKQAEKDLRESEERYHLIVDLANEGLQLTGPDANIIYINPSMSAMFGYKSNEMIGKPYFEFIHPSMQDSAKARFEERKQGVRGKRDYQLRHKNGTYLWVLMSSAPVLGADGQFQGVLSMFTDVSDRKRYEESLERALEQVKELNDLKSRFVSTASHEFRTPLAIILASVETLDAYRKQMDDEQINKRLNKIRLQVDHMRSIIEDVLLLSRMQVGKLKFDPTLADFDAFCLDIIEEFQNRPDIKHQIIYQCEAQPMIVRFDQKLMRQVFSNLVANAIKYSPTGERVWFDVRRTAQYLTITIKDEGIGIPEPDMKHLYEAFHRAANVGTISGTGLGLSIVKQSLDVHGGNMSVSSELGIGTTITVTIPITNPIESNVH